MKMEFSQMLRVLNFKTKLFLKREQMQVSPVYVEIVAFFLSFLCWYCKFAFSEKQPAVIFAESSLILHFQQKQKAEIAFYFATWFNMEFGTFSSFTLNCPTCLITSGRSAGSGITLEQ